jgi:non-specific serine/threonine protein kinase
LTPDVQDLVLEVCRRLDGLPLAIEIAAAQLRTVPLAQLVAGLTDRSRMLAALPAPPSYHRPLRETFDWSYDLCSPAEQTLWARLSVFAGSFDLAAATGVCAGGDLPDVDILDLIAGLIDKSVLVRDDDAGEARYRLLDTVRRYGMERLPGGAAEMTALCRRHRDWYLGRAEQFDAEWFGPGQESRSARMRADQDNMRAALTFCLTTSGEENAGLRLAAALRSYWFRCGASREGRLWLERALAADTAATPVRAAALACHSIVLGTQSDGAGAAGSAQAAIDLATRLHAPHLVARAEAYLGINVLLDGVDLPRARALLEGAVRSLTALGEVSDTVATARFCLATVALNQGDVRRATDLAAQARAYCRNHGDHSCLAVALYGSANIALAAGDTSRAERFLRECLPLQYDLNDTFGMPIAIETMAAVATAAGDNRRAARLLGAAHGVRRVVGKRFAGTADFQRRRLGTAERVRQALGEATFETAFRRGAALSLEEAVSYALGRDAEPGPVDTPSPGGLTPRERDVADLVAEGLSNRQIAARLGVSQRTVESHVENILRKLGFASRTQVAAWIARQRR